MDYGSDIICPQCRSRHGPAATACECGHVFEVPEEDPAPPRNFFLAALFFAVVTIISAAVAQKTGGTYLPIGGMLFTAVSATLGLRSWLYFYRKKRREAKPASPTTRIN